MKTVTVYKHDGTEAGTVDLPDDIFGIEPSATVLHQVITAQLANRRQGTASTKTRSEVDLSKSKFFRQKGTGRARVGSLNSPVQVGGGVAHGPKPRSYTQKINKKLRHLGLKSAYSIKAAEDNIRVVEDFEMTEPKTKSVAGVLKALKIDGRRIMFLVPGADENLCKSSRNIPHLNIEDARNASTYGVANADVLLMTRATIDRVKECLQK